MNRLTLIEGLKENKYKELLFDLYQDSSVLEKQKNRYIQALEKFYELYQIDEVEMYTSAGRSEVGGNHTDHQHGRVLAASINLDVIGVVSKAETVKVVSDKFDIKEIDIHDLSMKEEEKGTSEALIRGILAKFKENGYQIGGFKAYLTSDVLIGAGLSSSAAFEDIIGTILNGLYNNMTIDNVEIAKIGQYSENVYFGKPCGLMDQCACGVGGLISIDFKDPSLPVVEAVKVDFSEFKHSLCIVDTKASHENLTGEYAAIPSEMKEVAKYFGKEVLRGVDKETFYSQIAKVRQVTSDRATLRAIHFFEENDRVLTLVDRLNQHDIDGFKQAVKDSGNSSYKYLQNVFCVNDYQNQAVSLALALSEKILQDNGVCRVHGGGFAGTIQAFVKDEFVSIYKEEIEKVFGKDSCHILKIRKYGNKKIF